jgi:hypothetical protein
MQADLAYGSKMQRIKNEAENILQYERDLIAMPGGLPTFASIDAARLSLQVRICMRGGKKRFRMNGDLVIMASGLPMLANIDADRLSSQVKICMRGGTGTDSYARRFANFRQHDAAR